jgi:hypothetical protein
VRRATPSSRRGRVHGTRADDLTEKPDGDSVPRGPIRLNATVPHQVHLFAGSTTVECPVTGWAARVVNDGVGLTVALHHCAANMATQPTT